MPCSLQTILTDRAPPAGGLLCPDPLDWQGSDNPKIEGSKDAQDVGLALGGS